MPGLITHVMQPDRHGILNPPVHICPVPASSYNHVVVHTSDVGGSLTPHSGCYGMPMVNARHV